VPPGKALSVLLVIYVVVVALGGLAFLLRQRTPKREPIEYVFICGGAVINLLLPPFVAYCAISIVGSFAGRSWLNFTLPVILEVGAVVLVVRAGRPQSPRDSAKT
jgi:lipoprotein signal peptidase